MSASKSRLHEFLGRPPLPISLGIPGQGLHCDVGRRLSESVSYPPPTPSHHDLSISGLWLVLCHRSSSLIVIGQRRHELIKVCTFFVVATVVLHVSEPYSRTGLTLLLKILILVWSARSLELQTLFNCRKTALALPILALTSASVPPPPPLDVNYTAQIGKGVYLFQ